MDPVHLSQLAVTILAPYLAKAAGKASEKMGEDAWNKLKSLYDSVVRKFASDPYASQTLIRAQELPDDATRCSALIAVLAEHLKSDADFLAEVADSVRGAEAIERTHIHQRISISGQSRDVTQIGSVGGNAILDRNRET
ncbi:MAG TPA: hypothetical protein VII95_09455 [Terriglobales bacterium]|jgi:hypothetical protein